MSIEQNYSLWLVLQDDLNKNFNKIEDLLRHYCVQIDEAKKYDALSKFLKGYYYKCFKLKVPNKEGYLTGSIHAFPKNTRFKEPVINFAMGYQEDFEFFKKIATKIINETNPLFAFYGDTERIDLSGSQLEYYNNPYFFAILPKIKEFKKYKKTREGYNKQICPWASFEFLHDKKNKTQMNEFKKVLSEKELLTILEKYSEKLFKGEKGVGIFKKERLETKCRYSYLLFPRYFIREELRKRGVKLGTSRVEMYYYRSYPKKYSKELLSIFHNGLSEEEIEEYEKEFILRDLFKAEPKKAMELYAGLVAKRIEKGEKYPLDAVSAEFLVKALAKLKRIDPKKLKKIWGRYVKLNIALRQVSWEQQQKIKEETGPLFEEMVAMAIEGLGLKWKTKKKQG